VFVPTTRKSPGDGRPYFTKRGAILANLRLAYPSSSEPAVEERFRLLLERLAVAWSIKD
jgi:hypothetical protein